MLQIEKNGFAPGVVKNKILNNKIMLSIKETYNKIAEEWHMQHQTDDWWKNATDTFITFLKKDDLVLDIGCGGGTKSKYLLNHGLKVTGIDISDKMIEIAKRENPAGNFYSMDLAEVKNLENDFDGIFIQAVLLHVPKDEVAEKFKDIVSKLKVGGFIYASVKEKKEGGVDEEIKTENDYGYSYERFFSYYTQDEMKKLFTDLNLNIEYFDVTPSGGKGTHWIQIVGKK